MRQILLPGRQHNQSFQIEGPWNINDPVHENLCLAALYQERDRLGLGAANFSDLWEDPKLNEYLRGVFWNDDPEVLMFDANTSSDADFSSGTTWLSHFDAAKGTTTIDYTNLTGRSHFWDMQFIHSMACANQESPTLTRYRALMWAEFMYKVAIGESVTTTGGALSTPAQVALTQLGQVVVPAAPASYDPSGAITETIATYFSAATRPTGTDTIRYLLLRDDTYTNVDLGKRAMGSLMHLIQDSYARGHTRRTLLNQDDLSSASSKSLKFKSGTYGQFGDVVTFHNYAGQNEDEHDAFDEDTSSGLNPKKLSTFDKIVGGRDSIDRCQELLRFYAAKTRWAATDGPMALFERVFCLATNVTVADSNVNMVPYPTTLDTGVGAVAGGADPLWVRIQDSKSHPVYRVVTNRAWVAPGGESGWISISADTKGAAGTYVYRVTLNLPEDAVPSTLLLGGRAAGDNQITSIHVNGTKVDEPFGKSVSGPGYTATKSFSLNGAAFRKGDNHLEFNVQNNEGPTGLLVNFDTPYLVLLG